jgi:hypothetical protein
MDACVGVAYAEHQHGDVAQQVQHIALPGGRVRPSGAGRGQLLLPAAPHTWHSSSSSGQPHAATHITTLSCTPLRVRQLTMHACMHATLPTRQRNSHRNKPITCIRQICSTATPAAVKPHLSTATGGRTIPHTAACTVTGVHATLLSQAPCQPPPGHSSRPPCCTTPTAPPGADAPPTQLQRTAHAAQHSKE